MIILAQAKIVIGKSAEAAVADAFGFVPAKI